VFVGIVGLLSAGVIANRRWATTMAAPAHRRARARFKARETARRPAARRGGWVPARGA
jgi:hypothetical protein